MVHSSLSSFGDVEGGAAAVVAALMEAVTPSGTLMMPSFNHDTVFHEGGPGYYDPTQTHTINGAIPDCFWRLPGVHRSLDPTHAIAAWGRDAERYTRFHHRTLTMGPQSPLGLLAAEGGLGLLLGVDYHANTFHHVVETSTGAPCLGLRSEAYPVRLAGGRMVLGRTWGWRGGSCPFTDTASYSEDMRERGLEYVVMIGSCRATLFRLQDCFSVVSEILAQGKNNFPPCSGCSVRPRVVDATVGSDWDAARGEPEAGSLAWTY
ncbi:MAG: AAC(3) family N-acetyltransferase [Anaerolineales bacterium]|nr:AAC(3) family N-acetyltransferase [Anaerolineales bacterium]